MLWRPLLLPNYINNINRLQHALGRLRLEVQSIQTTRAGEDEGPLERYNLPAEWTSHEEEKALIAAIVQTPSLYWELIDILTDETFAAADTRQAWQGIAAAIEAEQAPVVPNGWTPTAEPVKAAQHLADLLKRRLVAATLQKVAKELSNEERPASEILTLMEEETAKAQTAVKESQAGQLTWAADLVEDILQEAEERRKQRLDTGRPVMGLPTGIPKLDMLINGMSEGLYLLGGAPGVGKTTFALQMAATVTQGAPVVYVTWENSPVNLTLKAIAGRAGINVQEVSRGYADIGKLREAAHKWQPVAERLALIEGNERLTIGQIRALALRAMNKHKAEQCLIVVDYLQMMAKASQEWRHLATVRERVEVLGAALREMATRLHSPVVGLASQNRAQGAYGKGNGAAALDSLKESGDLEYSADVVLFLTHDKEQLMTPPARAIKLTVAKNRNGDTGDINLVFRPDISSFGEEDWKH